MAWLQASFSARLSLHVPRRYLRRRTRLFQKLLQRTWDLGESEKEINEEHPGKRITVHADVKDPDICHVGRERPNDVLYEDAYPQLFEGSNHLSEQVFYNPCGMGLKELLKLRINIGDLNSGQNDCLPRRKGSWTDQLLFPFHWWAVGSNKEGQEVDHLAYV